MTERTTIPPRGNNADGTRNARHGRWIRRLAWLWASLTAIALAGCHDPPRRFFASCGSSDECETGTCYQGYCTKSCATSDECSGGVCIAKICKPATSFACSSDATCAPLVADTPCRTSSCVAGHCAIASVAASTSCSMGCSGGEALGGTCSGGLCKATGTQQACADSDPCTVDSCVIYKGCTHVAVTCQDGDACTLDQCAEPGVCPHGAVACDDGDACTSDGCDSKTGCTHVAINCQDGDACTTDTCSPTSGCGHDKLNCDDGEVCTIDTCAVDLGCSHTADACDDKSLCTIDSCTAATGCRNTAIVCDDAIPCTADTCLASKGCQFDQLSGTPCDDGNTCTSGDTCQGGLCKAGQDTCGCQSDAECPKGGNPCLGTMVCDKSALPHVCKIAAGTAVVCTPDPAKPCTSVQCDPISGTCASITSKPDTTPCDADGSNCTAGDHCLAGACVAGAAISCDDGNKCTDDSCTATLGCGHVPSLVGTQCDDGSACTAPDACTSKQTCTGAAISCDDANPCTNDACAAASGCSHVAANNPCDDGYACSTDDHCAAGKCVATKLIWAQTLGSGGKTIGRGVAYLPSPTTPTLLAVGSIEISAKQAVRQIAARDISGNTLWDYQANQAGIDRPEAVAVNAGQGIAVAGETDAPGDGLHGYILRLDASGTKLWQTEIKAGSTSDTLHALTATSTGWLAAGYREDGAVRQPLWARLADNATAQPVTATTAMPGNAEAYSTAFNFAGDVLVVGTAVNNGNSGGFGVRINPSGQVLFAKQWTEGQGKASVYGAAATGTGWVLVGTAPNGSGKLSMWMVRIDDQGIIQWQRTYDVLVESVAYGVAARPDGFAVVGAAKPQAGGAYDTWFVRTDLFGNMWYQRTEPLANAQTLSAVAGAGDAGYVLAGTADNGSGSDMVMMRANAWGYSSCPTVGKCLSLAPAQCDDTLACTTEDCDPTLGCQHKIYLDTAPCGSTTTCLAGICK